MPDFVTPWFENELPRPILLGPVCGNCGQPYVHVAYTGPQLTGFGKGLASHRWAHRCCAVSSDAGTKEA